MNRLSGFTGLVVAALVTTGCSLVAPNYSASIENVQRIKQENISPSAVKRFSSVAGKDNPAAISLRGSSLASPYEGSYSAYLTEAVRQELALAGKLDPDSGIELTGSLVRNDIDASGFSTAFGEMEARFILTRDGQIRYDQVKSVRTEWESSFAGAIAIPKAQQEYPRLVQKLLSALFADRAFMDALKPMAAQP
jgi:hypothetical protein